MARPKLPTEQKILQGTYRPYREKGTPTDVQLAKTSVILSDVKSVSCPKTITDKYCRKYWKTLTKNLLTLHVLSSNDIPQLEDLIITLQRLREVNTIYLQLSATDDEYDLWEKRRIRLSTRFEDLASKYYVNPQARSQLKLAELNVIKTGQEIVKEKDVIDSLLQED